MAAATWPGVRLDDPARSALEGPQAYLAERHGGALSYPRDVAPFIAISPDASPGDWASLAAWAGPGGQVARLAAGVAGVPAGWEVARRALSVQMVDDAVVGADDARVRRLTPGEVPEMLTLVARTSPGPFLERTIGLGAYWGVREQGELVAMAGERMRPEGWTEVSAVCTAPAWQGRGLGATVVRKTVLEIRRRGDRAFLHVFADNQGAIRLYRSLGFARRRELDLLVARVADEAAA